MINGHKFILLLISLFLSFKATCLTSGIEIGVSAKNLTESSYESPDLNTQNRIRENNNDSIKIPFLFFSEGHTQFFTGFGYARDTYHFYQVKTRYLECTNANKNCNYWSIKMKYPFAQIGFRTFFNPIHFIGSSISYGVGQANVNQSGYDDAKISPTSVYGLRIFVGGTHFYKLIKLHCDITLGVEFSEARTGQFTYNNNDFSNRDFTARPRMLLTLIFRG